MSHKPPKSPKTTTKHHHRTKPNLASPIFEQNQPRYTVIQQNINYPYHHRMIDFQALFHSQPSTGEGVPIQGNPFQQNQPRSTMTQQNINCLYHHRMIDFQALFHSQRSTSEGVPIQGNPGSHTKRDLCELTNHINPIKSNTEY